MAFIPPHCFFRVPTETERLATRPATIKRSSFYLRPAAGAKAAKIDSRHKDGRSKIEALIAKDAAWRVKNAAERPEPGIGHDAFDVILAEAFAPQPKHVPQSARQRKLARLVERSRRLAVIHPDKSLTWQENYEQYINSPEWRAFRLMVFAGRGRRCQSCTKNEGQMHVHHLHYRTFRHEQPADVLVLCEGCHTLVHESKRLASAAARRKKK
jgi:hypothetical protein